MSEFDFEKAMKRIEEIEDIIAEGKASLQDTLDLFKESTELIIACTERIKKAELTIEEYKQSFTDSETDLDGI